jgi:hypothetical protein
LILFFSYEVLVMFGIRVHRTGYEGNV